MGIETALAAIGTWLGASGTAATAVGAMAATTAATTAMTAAAALKQSKAGGINIPDPIAPPQATKAPERGGFLAKNVAAGRMGNASTFLTGGGGIDASTLNLGTNTLLGR